MPVELSTTPNMISGRSGRVEGIMPPGPYHCPRCEKDLLHDKRYCPLFPEVEPPDDIGYHEGKPFRLAGKKWDRCVCLIHTCYDIRAMRARRE